MMFQDKTIAFYFEFAIFCLLCKEIKMQNLQKYKWNRRLLIISGMISEYKSFNMGKLINDFTIMCIIFYDYLILEDSNGANMLQSIKNDYECEMALRNMNLIIIGSSESSDTIFTYDQVKGQPFQHRT